MKRLSQESGLTLVEVLISIAIILLFIIAAAQTLLNSQYFSSYARHKVQAMYAAQQIIEQQRRANFVASSSTTTSAVVLDSSNSFSGTSILTITNIDSSRNRVQVEINWLEQILSAKVTMREYYSTNISNNAIAN